MKHALVVLCLLLTACQKDETVSGQTGSTDVWVLNRINDNPIGPRITVLFPEEGRVKGQAPCNSYSGPQTAPLPWIKLGPLQATERACPDLALETAYFKALETMAFVELLGDTLLMTSQDGAEMEFRRDADS